jgi:hypothetical protein
MGFGILGDISDIETIATGKGIREIERLRRVYGRGRWRKRKGMARIRLDVAGVQSLAANGREMVPTEADRGGEAFGGEQYVAPCYGKAVGHLTRIIGPAHGHSWTFSHLC